MTDFELEDVGEQQVLYSLTMEGEREHKVATFEPGWRDLAVELLGYLNNGEG